MRHEDHTHSSISGRAAAFRAWLAKRRADLWRVRAGRLVLVLAVAVLTTGAAAALLYAVSVTGGMSGVDVSAVPQMKETTRVYDRNGTVIYEFYEKKRTVVPLARMSPRVLHAIISIEDRNFYRHSGFDVKAIARAALANLESRKITQGASTITQQLARNTFLTQERSYKRKLQELRLALKIEHTYTKEQILEFYANRVYLGSGFYGVEAASQGYFANLLQSCRSGKLRCWQAS